MLELQALGAALVDLPESQLALLSLGDALHAAVLEAKRIRSHEARRRQLQYIGRLMREADAAPIRAALEALDSGSAQAPPHHRRPETRREPLPPDRPPRPPF